ncbi:gluconokinase, partial [Klebsiella pneumoniae]
MSTTNHDHHVYVLMGVSGSGKSAAYLLPCLFLIPDFLKHKV